MSLVCKQSIPRATRESFNNPGDRGQVSLTMRSLRVNELAQYTVSTKDGRMMIDAKGWSRFKSKSYLAVGDVSGPDFWDINFPKAALVLTSPRITVS